MLRQLSIKKCHGYRERTYVLEVIPFNGSNSSKGRIQIHSGYNLSNCEGKLATSRRWRGRRVKCACCILNSHSIYPEEDLQGYQPGGFGGFFSFNLLPRKFCLKSHKKR